jgi:hypothetical protein
MKTKNIIIAVAFGAALASAPMAKANADYLELISGGSSAFGTLTQTGTLGFSSLNFAGWDLSAVTGTVSLNPISVGLSSVNIQGEGLNNISITFYTDNPFSAPQYGGFPITQPSVFDVSDTVNAYSGTLVGQTSASVNTPGYQGVLSDTFSETGPAKPYENYQTALVPGIPGLYSIVDTITIDATSPGGTGEIDVDLTLSTVPDGGMTLMMLGSSLVVLAGIRSKFGNKLS